MSNNQPDVRTFSKAISRLDHPARQNIPASKRVRDHLLATVRSYVRRNRLTPPLGLEELKDHSTKVLDIAGCDTDFDDLAAVLLSNEAWRDRFAEIPFHKRLLLLPQCLRSQEHCRGKIDEFGLLCAGCGECVIHDIQTQAETLGYVVMVAEGSSVVTAMIASGQIRAVVGVSCLDMLQRVYPFMEAAAIPGIALPLLYDGCVDTALDMDWLWETLSVSTDRPVGVLDLESIRADTNGWFTPQGVAEVLGPAEDRTRELAQSFLSRGGKRWRPFLAVSLHKALLQDSSFSTSQEAVRQVALAVECFHKASLIHDDIEDDDAVRYDQPTLHQAHGVPIALNVGDYLLGEGYRLLARIDAEPKHRATMLAVAAEGHRQLCIGQGAELAWSARPRVLSVREVLEIFRGKTAPAFEVALGLGAALAEKYDDLSDVISDFSEAIGIAYQIRDDLRDGESGANGCDLEARRPSVLLAVACERAEREDATFLRSMLCDSASSWDPERIREIYDRYDVRDVVAGMLEFYKGRAVRALISLTNPDAKALLRRVVAKIFGDIDKASCCDERRP